MHAMSSLSFRLATVVLLILVVSPYLLADAARFEEDTTPVSYGVDVSFPIQGRVSTNYPGSKLQNRKISEMPLQVLGDRHSAYMKHLKGCRETYPDPKHNACDRFEYERLLMNRRQPQSMQNYTETGFQKIRAPKEVFDLIQDFWKDNHSKGKKENWGVGNSILNHWESPTELVSVDDRGLRGSGPRLKEHIWAAASATLEEWTSQELQPCSLYGIRVYKEGTVMMPHVDRLPLIASAMINVAQDVDEDWPFEMYDHDGMAHNVTLQPGEMLLFESHSVIHGHPFPLKGRFQAMIFVHFELTGRSLHRDESGNYQARDVNEQYREAIKGGHGGQSAASDGRLPPYIKRESPEEEHWRNLHPEGWEPPPSILPPSAHLAAKKGNLKMLKEELESDNSEKVLTERDEKGWQILHQGVTSGNKEVVELLVDHGAEINARTYGGYGETPLRIAEKELGFGHPIVDYLKGMGALSLGPEL